LSRVAPPLRFPAEWEPHRATWIGWPHHEPDWPGKLEAVRWAYAEIVRVLARFEPVEILCASEDDVANARACLSGHAVRLDRVRLHLVPTDRVWLRDSAPTGVLDAEGRVVLLNWAFNAWAKYDNWRLDANVGPALGRITALPRLEPPRPDNADRLVLEGGGIETNGDGLLLVTDEWLLSDTQIRNPGLTRADYERAFAEWLGTRRTIWLGEG
jgi:agmatine deiminase